MKLHQKDYCKRGANYTFHNWWAEIAIGILLDANLKILSIRSRMGLTTKGNMPHDSSIIKPTIINLPVFTVCDNMYVYRDDLYMTFK